MMPRLLTWIFAITLLVGCTPQQVSPQPHQTALNTAPCSLKHLSSGDSGFGGTGHSSECGFGGTGVIGTITDFGSIWVNGLEIELAKNLNVHSNLGHSVALGIGQQVITVVDDPTQPETAQVQVFYPIAGKITRSAVDTLEVAGQTVKITPETQGLKQYQQGDFIAINAWPQTDGSWLATRIDPNPTHIERHSFPTLTQLNTAQLLAQGSVVYQAGRPMLAPYNLPLPPREYKHPFAIVHATRSDQAWVVESVRTLTDWKVDWKQHPLSLPIAPRPQKHMHDKIPYNKNHSTPHAPPQYINGTKEALHVWYPHDNYMMRENMQHLQETKDMSQTFQENRENHETMKDSSSTLYEQRENQYPTQGMKR